MNFIFAAISFAIGAFISYINFRISLAALKKSQNAISFSFIIRQVINVAFLVALWLIGDNTSCNTMYLLIGGVLGVTVPSMIFTRKLLNASLNNKDGEDNNG